MKRITILLLIITALLVSSCQDKRDPLEVNKTYMVIGGEEFNIYKGTDGHDWLLAHAKDGYYTPVHIPECQKCKQEKQ